MFACSEDWEDGKVEKEEKTEWLEKVVVGGLST